MAEKSLERFDLTRRFAAIAAGTDEHPSKADLIRQVMDTLDWTDLGSAVMIGDSRYDGVGALEAGVDFVPLTYGFGFSRSNCSRDFSAMDWCFRVATAA